jgi:PAS domain S-box-containing protein
MKATITYIHATKSADNLAPQGDIVTWNAGAERIKDYTGEKVIGREFFSLLFSRRDQERHGGNISVSSKPGEGSTFRLALAESDGK